MGSPPDLVTSRRVPEPVALRPHASRRVSGASHGVSPPVRGAAALTEERPLSLFWSNGQIRICFFMVLPLYPAKNHTKNRPLYSSGQEREGRIHVFIKFLC